MTLLLCLSFNVKSNLSFCLLTAHKKLAGGTFRKHAVKVIERVDKQKVDELMDSYLRLLSKTEVFILSLFRVLCVLVFKFH